jgi:hypothetical protein
MKITRTSQASNITRTLDLPITQEQLDAFNTGTLIQRAFPHLTSAEREFILTGMTQEEWDEVFKDED